MERRGASVTWVMRPAAHRLALLAGLALLVGCDHATKIAAKGALEGRAPRQLVRGVLELRYTENTDVAFNLLRAVPEHVRAPILIAVGGAAVLALLGLVLLCRAPGGFARVALLLVSAGAVGNYLDRLVRGYVVDFVHVPHWPVFNVADAYVTIGGILFGWYLLRQRSRQPVAP
jgi:signal peptidase II